MTIEVFKGQGKHPWYVRTIFSNNENALVSEGYFSKWNAKRAARKMFPGQPIVVLEKPYKKFP